MDKEGTIASYTVGHHLHADDTRVQAHVHPQEFRSCFYKIECCVGSTKDWCAKRGLQLNPDKTELIVFGLKARLSWLQREDMSLQFESVVIKPSKSVRDLDVQLGSEL